MGKECYLRVSFAAGHLSDTDKQSVTRVAVELDKGFRYEGPIELYYNRGAAGDEERAVISGEISDRDIDEVNAFLCSQLAPLLQTGTRARYEHSEGVSYLWVGSKEQIFDAKRRRLLRIIARSVKKYIRLDPEQQEASVYSIKRTVRKACKDVKLLLLGLQQTSISGSTGPDDPLWVTGLFDRFTVMLPVTRDDMTRYRRISAESERQVGKIGYWSMKYLLRSPSERLLLRVGRFTAVEVSQRMDELGFGDGARGERMNNIMRSLLQEPDITAEALDRHILAEKDKAKEVQAASINL